jgi:hypothetical protein
MQQSVSYIAEHVVGTGSFGVVYQVNLTFELSKLHRAQPFVKGI